MNCVVTAGPTYEPVDEVRRLTNFSTGRLGTLLANRLAAQGHATTLMLGHYATFRDAAKSVRVVEFSTTQSLFELLRDAASAGCNAIFHAAAVSDFTIAKVWRRRADGGLDEITARKIPTQEGSVFAEMRPAPKIIAQLRSWHPHGLLVGWKYELDGTRADVLAKGLSQIRANTTDACVVNGAAYGEGFGLLSSGGGCAHCPDEAGLFEALLVLTSRHFQAVGSPGGAQGE
jgi:phosphopantothenoylcysteine decarboxylase/phosphopantothenate--cysteine ligase